MCRHRPIFPGRRQPSIFGTSELNFRVRDGNGWTLTVINTDLFRRAACLAACTLLFIKYRQIYSILFTVTIFGDPYEIRTRVAGVRGRSLRPLDQRAIFWCTAGFHLLIHQDNWCTIKREPSGESPFRSNPIKAHPVFGAPSGTRTRDTLIKSQVLYQLS